MGLNTFSDPGVMAHAGQAVTAAQGYEQQLADEELTRARSDAMRMQAQADLERMELGKRATQERAARTMQVAVDELAQMGVDPTDINLADDFAYVAERNPALAEQAIQMFPDPAQKGEAALHVARLRRTLELGQSAQEKRGMFEDFMLLNGPMLTELASMSGGDGQGEHPTIANLRQLAQDQGTDSMAFELQMRTASAELAGQTKRRLQREAILTKASEIYAQGATNLMRNDRERATEIMADLSHNPKANAGALLLELTALMNGLGESYQEALTKAAQEGAATTRALVEQGQAEYDARRNPKPEQGSGAQMGPPRGAQGQRQPQQPAIPAGPAPDPAQATRALSEWIEKARTTGRGLIQEDTLLEVASMLFGRKMVKTEVRAALSGSTLPAERQSADEDQILIERLTLSGKAKTAAEARKMIQEFTPEQRKQALGRFAQQK
jgi:hypothetical protein